MANEFTYPEGRFRRGWSGSAAPLTLETRAAFGRTVAEHREQGARSKATRRTRTSATWPRHK